MKQVLQTRQTQKLAMTPQLQQGLRLLQMSSVELGQEIQMAHEANPLLEFGDDVESSDSGSTDETIIDSKRTETAELNEDNRYSAENDDILPFESPALPGTSGWDEMQGYFPIDQRRPDLGGNQAWDPAQADTLEGQSSLRDSLRNQAMFLFGDAREQAIALHIIQEINDAGYLDASLTEISGALPESDPLEIEQVLSEVQKMDPPGVGARDPQECLSIQLNYVDQTTPGLETARILVSDHLNALARKDYTALRRIIGVSQAELADAVEIIKRLNPHPGYSISNARIDYIVPDILVQKRKHIWFATLNPKALPKISINQDYQALINRGSADEFGGLKEQLKNARWLISNLEKRHETILAVATAIVEQQQEFFNHGPQRLRPMILGDVAEKLDVHESTVSRATVGKYLSAPQGVFELKYFFSSQVGSDSGDGVSSVAVQEQIRNIVKNEPAAKPCSDEKICKILSTSGIQVARRTVAKYREQMGIPPSSKRKSV